jgi:hypothetical protein
MVRLENKMFISLPPVPEGAKYSLTILDRQNQVIEQLVPKDGDEMESLRALFSKVRRKVLDLDAAYESLLKELQTKANG